MLASRSLFFVVSGPSGAGKGTALKVISTGFPEIGRATTFTTRNARPGEENGVDYRFISDAEFDRGLKNGDIVESTTPYGDYRYGSPRSFLSDDGSHLLAELDYRGFARYRQMSPRRVIGLFVLPPDVSELSQRITDRHAETNLEARIATLAEMKGVAPLYDYVVINSDLDGFSERLRAIVRSELIRFDGLQKALAL